ncbi:MAG: hypothetical protein N3G48_07640 [Sulfolobales archaeon]|nr:hypothetical protein [Sulfolobales archaeon]
MFEIEEKVDYGSVINMQLNRIAVARSSIFDVNGKETYFRNLHVGNVVHENVVLGNSASYLSAIRGLVAILIPELRGKSIEILNDAEQLLFLTHACYRAKLEKRVDDCSVANPKLGEKINDIKKKYGYDLNTVFNEKIIVELCDMALEVLLVNINSAGLLMRGRSVKLGRVGE